MQLGIRVEQLSRFWAVTNFERTSIFRRALFELEPIDKKFAGWSDGTHWNGTVKAILRVC